jgi:hypothetical protein
MIDISPVTQTIFGDEKGNCFAACIATLLRYPIHDVPNFCADYPADWWERMQNWLATRGLYAIEMRVDDKLTLEPMPAVHVILTGKSPRGEFGHCVVGKVNNESSPEGTIDYVHDPHPDGTFLDGKPNFVMFLGALRI